MRFQWHGERTEAVIFLSAPVKNPMEKESIFHGHLLGQVATRDSSYALVGNVPHQTRKQGDAAAEKDNNPAGNVSSQPISVTYSAYSNPPSTWVGS